MKLSCCALFITIVFAGALLLFSANLCWIQGSRDSNGIKMTFDRQEALISDVNTLACSINSLALFIN